MSRVGFETTISALEREKTVHALERAVTFRNIQEENLTTSLTIVVVFLKTDIGTRQHYRLSVRFIWIHTMAAETGDLIYGSRKHLNPCLFRSASLILLLS
jgi:hypothetical protein